MKTIRNIFAVCDLEVEYAYHFMEYLNRKKTLPFEIRVFTSREKLCEFARDHRIELLLISDTAMCREVEEQEIGQILILSGGVRDDKLKQYPSIYKYQSSAQVMREVMARYGEEHGTDPVPVQVVKKETEIIGIYSPVGRSMKTTFALTLGQILAKNKAVLYLNLEEYSGFEYLFEHVYEETLSDLLYYLRQGNPNFIIKLNSMIRTISNLDYLPPASSPADIQCTSYEEWVRLLQEIVDTSNYEAVILDIGDGVPQLFRLLDQCTRIYMPVRNDPMSQAKIQQFENLLRMSQGEAVLEKIQKIRLPYHRTTRKGQGYLDDLVWSELGDYVRELLRKGAEMITQEQEEKKKWGWSSLPKSAGS